MKEKNIAMIVVLGLSFTGLINISISATKAVWSYEVDNNIDEDIDEKNTYEIISSYNGFNSQAFLISTGNGDNIMEVNEEIVWKLTIVVENTFEWNMTDVVVTDIISPQLLVSEEDSYSNIGDFTLDKKGSKQSGATHLNWDIGNLNSTKVAVLELIIKTSGKVGDHFYKESGHYILNSGAKLKFTNANTGQKYNLHTEKIEFDIPGEMPLMPPLLYLFEKNPDGWKIREDCSWARLNYNLAGSEFVYEFYAFGLKRLDDYQLIYYEDPWPGDNPGKLIATFSLSLDSPGYIYEEGSVNLNMDLPHPNDDNYPDGAKLWLVPDSDYDDANNQMSAWNPGDYLFENNLITYDDTDVAYLLLYEKDPDTWDIIEGGAWGNLKYNLAGSKFVYEFYAFGLKREDEYHLIYYADPWPGNHPGELIDTFSPDSLGNVHQESSVDLNMDLPDPYDDNYLIGAKLWLVPKSDYDDANNQMSAWIPEDYLFENNLITFDDTD